MEEPDKIVMVGDENGVEEHLYWYLYSKCMMLGTDTISVADILDSMADNIVCWNGKDENGKIVKYISFKDQPDDYYKYASMKD